MTRVRRNGFTLIEMLVALAVFALIAGGALALLRFSVDAELAGRVRTEQLAAMRRFVSVWTADMAQAVPRPSRDEAGAVHAALESGGVVLVRLTRSGWENLDASPRPSLQKVEWRWDGKALVRAGYPYPDGAAAEPGAAMLPLGAAPRLRFRSSDGNWHDRWEPQRRAEMPSAIEILLPQPGGEPLRLVSLVGVNGP